MKTLKQASLVTALTLSFSHFAMATPRVVSSIYPIQQIANAIVGKPTALLADSYLSPHHYSITPKDIDKILNTDLFIWVDPAIIPQLDQFAKRRLDKKKPTIMVTQLPNIQLIKLTEHHHEHGEHEHDHDHGHNKMTHDPHVWLSPDNAKVIASAIAKQLTILDAEQASTYQANLTEFIDNITATQQSISEKFSANPPRPFYIFHDAYGYFEHSFNIKHAGKIRAHSAQSPRTKDMIELKKQIDSTPSACLFREPQFKSPLVNQLASSTEITLSVLDPLGYQKEKTDIKGGYMQILKNIAHQLQTCETPK